MNKIRRKQLQEASELIAKAQGIIESVKDDEQEAHDNLPESIQYGEKGQQMEEYIDMLDEAYGQCDDLMSKGVHQALHGHLRGCDCRKKTIPDSEK